MSTKENYERWLNSTSIDEATKEALRKMSKEEIDDAFFKDVEFGTAGMRGVLGPGTNRLNNFTVRKATVAFAKYLLEVMPNAKEEGVVISHDNRHMSREFTLLSADVLNDFGIKTYIFDALRPTPELSFAVRYLKAAGGIMITASHNPKQYNGYKVYDETGCQLVPDKIARLLEIIVSLPNELEIKYDVADQRGENILLTSEVDDAYVKRFQKYVNSGITSVYIRSRGNVKNEISINILNSIKKHYNILNYSVYNYTCEDERSFGQKGVCIYIDAENITQKE